MGVGKEKSRKQDKESRGVYIYKEKERQTDRKM